MENKLKKIYRYYTIGIALAAKALNLGIALAAKVGMQC